jgi:hypothetical protein
MKIPLSTEKYERDVYLIDLHNVRMLHKLHGRYLSLDLQSIKQQKSSDSKK